MNLPPGSRESSTDRIRDQITPKDVSSPCRGRSSSLKRGVPVSRGRSITVTGAQTRSQSAKSGLTECSEKDNPLLTIRKSQRSAIIDKKRALSPTIGISTSTPLCSPNHSSGEDNNTPKVNNDDTSTFISTPFAASAGTALISNPDSLPPINNDCSLSDINTFLDSVTVHINHYGTNTCVDQNWKSKFHSKYISLSSSLSKVRMIALERELDHVLERCSELATLLDEHKLKWSLKCTSESNLSSFHGFPSLVENSSDQIAPRGIKQIGESSSTIMEILNRLTALEAVIPALNSLKAHQPRLAERVAVLEANETLDMNARLISLENTLKQLPSSDALNSLLTSSNELVQKCANTDLAIKNITEVNEKLNTSQRALLRELNTFKTNTAVELEYIRQSNSKNIPFPTTQEQTAYIANEVSYASNLKGTPPVLSNHNSQRVTSWVESQRKSYPLQQLTAPNEVSHAPNLKGTPSVPIDPNSQHVTSWSESQRKSNPYQQLAAPHNAQLIPEVNTGLQPTINKKAMCDIPNPMSNDDNASIQSNNSDNVSNALNLQGKLIKSNIAGLKRLISPDPAKMSKCTLSDIYRNQLPAVDSQSREIQRSLHYYMKNSNHDIMLCEEVTVTIERAIDWSAQVRNLYHSLGIHQRSQASKLYDSLPKFSKHSEITVFEFFRRFAAYTEDFDISEEKAELLYNKFLSSSIQDEVSEFKNDYESIKRVLIHRYGDLKTLTTDILLPVSKLSKPNSHHDPNTSFEYYRTLNSAFQRINKLLVSEDIPSDEAKEYIFSIDFLHLLLSYVPYDAKSKFVDKMQMMDEDTVRIRGKTAFKLLINAVYQSYQSHDTAARTEAPPNSELNKVRVERSKTVRAHAVSSERNITDSDADNDREPLAGSVNFQNKASSSKPASQLKFPCILDGHKHQLNECREFFFRSPKERIEDRRKFPYRHCLVCLQSSDNCSSKGCSNMDQVPFELICKECKKASKSNPRRSPYSVLFCFNPQHTKPSNVEILKAIEKYIPGFDVDNLKAPINMASHFQVLTGLKPKSKDLSRSKKPNLLDPTPVFNTSTGKEEKPSPEDIINEVKHDSIGVMQFLNINGKSILCLYDRGANQHLVEGKLAEEIGMKVTGTEPSAIGVVSGGKIWTEYGTYQMILGPTPSGKYHELEAQGMQTITSKIPGYDLTAVNEEARQHSNLPLNTPLPQYIGKDRIGLLIGLKSPELEPECVLSLPSGIGLYKAPFKDIFGSYYCYGGPHSSFSEANHKFHGNVNHFNIYFSEVVNQYRNSLYPSLMYALKPDIVDSECALSEFKTPSLSYSYTTLSGETIFPTPVDSKSFNELGQEVFDECLPDYELCSSLHCQCFSVTAFKAKVPLRKLRSFLDEQDKDDTVNFRCEKCKLCKCSVSNRTKMMSLNERIEQQMIEESVSVNLDEKRVYVDLPFVKPADQFLSDKHGGNDNYKQAEKVYKSQCKASDDIKARVKEAHKDLVSKGFLKKLEDLPQQHQELINNGAFRHYMPWRYVLKDSASTPVRLVVDPSMSGLNECLAKGENKMKKIQDILNRARTKKFIWTSDISKLYNRLHLKPSSYRYQLFLFGDLDPSKPPDVYVMLVAWYGVSSSANQATYALEKLATLLKDQYPLAYIVIILDTYVDDMIGGDHTKEKCLEQIEQVLKVLEAGGFSAKFVILSGHPELEDSLKVLGYKWNVSQDTFSPGFTELNFNIKKRGIKSPNPFPVQNPADVSLLLESTEITRRMVISRVCEFWDTSGWWEPYKLQLKLDCQALSGLDWDKPLSQDLQKYWRDRFAEFLEIPSLSIPRYLFPANTAPKSIRLLCISDAAEFAGGGAVYAGVELENGNYSCQLMASKSRLMKNSVPRNELEAIRITAALAYDIKLSLGDLVTEVLYFTDSSIAMAWCHNTNKRLRLFCLNRVMEIRRLIEAVVGTKESIPLYHIDGSLNPADMITKPSSLKPSDLSSGSLWVSGYPWMKLPKKSMPKTTFLDIQLSATQSQLLNEECFPEVPLPSAQVSSASLQFFPTSMHCSGCPQHNGQILIEQCFGISNVVQHCLECSCNTNFHSFVAKAGRVSTSPIDVIKNGFSKSIRIMTKVLDFIWSVKHKAHQSRGLHQSQDCKKCSAIAASNGVPPEYFKILSIESFNHFLRIETCILLSKLNKVKLQDYEEKDGIFYAHGRIPADAEVIQKDLNFKVFFDGNMIKGVLPIVSADSDLFFSLLMEIHHKTRKHAGNEATLNELMKYVFPINNPRRIIQEVRRNCPRCRMLLKKTLELEMGNHPQSRYQIVPAFYHSMCDIVYGFKSKPFRNSRSTRSQPEVKIYALVIVCLLSSATSILVLEGLETQDVVMALERHSGRHGVPSCLFVDQGTQLTSLDKVEFTLRDANHQLRESLGIEVYPSTSKSHMERGRVERKIRTLRDMLNKSAINTDIALTPIQWETIFSKMASEIDDIPLARADQSNSADFGWDILTPNRFKLGRSHNRVIEGPMHLTESSCPTHLLKRLESIQSYWYQLLLDRMHHLIPKPIKMSHTDEVKMEDIVVFRFLDNINNKLEKWKLGKVVDIIKNGRGVLISYPNTSGKKCVIRFVERSPRDVCVISSVTDLNLNSKEFFQSINTVK